ncbi:MAG: type VI secretion system tube protein Hcp [Opitutales bacterium]|nr:type VI secretion system tube protein Hcp [Opitutales bacterium]
MFSLTGLLLLLIPCQAEDKEIYFYSEALPGNVTINQQGGWNQAILLGQQLAEGDALEDQGIIILKEINKASPELALRASSGSPLPELNIIVFDPQNPSAPFFQITLSEVLVHKTNLQPKDQNHYLEKVAFRFRTATWRYTNFLMRGDEEGLEYFALWDYPKEAGKLSSPGEGYIPEGAYKLFREGLQVEKITEPTEALQLTWPAQEDGIYDIYASPDLQDDFDTHVKAVQAVEDGLVNAIVEISPEHDRMFFIVRLRLEE